MYPTRSFRRSFLRGRNRDKSQYGTRTVQEARRSVAESVAQEHLR